MNVLSLKSIILNLSGYLTKDNVKLNEVKCMVVVVLLTQITVYICIYIQP